MARIYLFIIIVTFAFAAVGCDDSTGAKHEDLSQDVGIQSDGGGDASSDGGEGRDASSDGTSDSCIPATCEAQFCGTISDGCGGTLECGDCSSGMKCGINGVPNRCAEADTCANGTLDAGETNIDCGGSCSACGQGKTCLTDADCSSDRCEDDMCSAPMAWTNVSPMPTARAMLAATFGQDGRLYVIGGISPNLGTLDRVEAFVPSRNSWTSLAGLPFPRYGHAAVTANDGKIWVIGGVLGDTDYPTSTVVIYDPTTNTWQPGPGLNHRRMYAAAAVGPDGRIYVIGGFDLQSTDKWLRSVEIYDPNDNTWTVSSFELNDGRAGAAAAFASDGLLYVMGGATETGKTQSIESFDPASPGWFTGTQPMPTAREGLAAVAGPKGLIWAIGGIQSSQQNHLTTVERFDPASQSWTSELALPAGRRWAAAALGPDGKIYVAGGLGSDTISAQAHATVFVLSGI